MSLSAAQLVTLEAELKNDPRQLGYAAFLAINDYLNLVACLNFIRDGVTPFPNNGVIGPSGAVTSVSNATPVVVTTTAPHGLATGDGAVIAGNSAVSGAFVVTVLSATTFSLNGSTANGAVAGGTWAWCVAGVRNQSVSTQQIIGSIAVGDLITAGGGTAATADQFGKIMLFNSLCNDGAVALTNPDGTDNNNAKILKQIVGAATPSHAAIAALESRLGSRAEQLFALSGSPPGVIVVNADVQAAIASGNA